jgi:hypothetical protein
MLVRTLNLSIDEVLQVTKRSFAMFRFAVIA